MADRDGGHPSHTMWVINPVSLPQYENAPPSILLEQGNVGDDPLLSEKPWMRSGIAIPHHEAYKHFSDPMSDMRVQY